MLGFRPRARFAHDPGGEAPAIECAPVQVRDSERPQGRSQSDVCPGIDGVVDEVDVTHSGRSNRASLGLHLGMTENGLKHWGMLQHGTRTASLWRGIRRNERIHEERSGLTTLVRQRTPPRLTRL